MKRIHKRILIVCSVILLISLYYYFFIYGFGVSLNSLNVSNVKVTGNTIFISGETANSALGYSGYNTELDGNQLLIKPRYSFVSYFNPYGKFQIKYEKNGQSITKLILIGKDKIDKKQIWPINHNY